MTRRPRVPIVLGSVTAWRRRLWLPVLSLLALASAVGPAWADTPVPTPPPALRSLEALPRMPIQFEPNVGQVDSRYRFLSRMGPYRLFLTATEAVLDMRTLDFDPRTVARASRRVQVQARLAAERAQKLTGGILTMRLVGARPDAATAAEDKLPGTVSYYRGSDPSQWRRNVPTYRRVHYHGVYPGIDLVFHGNQQKLEYDLVVAPGANPNVISLEFRGADRMEIDGAGDLVLRVAGREVRHRRPDVYQDVAGVREAIPARYVRRGPDRVGIDVGTYVADATLVIDPGVDLGNGQLGIGNAIVADGAGNSYITGFVYVNPPDDFQTSNGFVAKVDANNAIAWSAVFGGGVYTTTGTAVALDATGNVYVTGATNSPILPVLNAFQATLGGGQPCVGDPPVEPCDFGDAFVGKWDASGVMAYLTYLGGTGLDFGQAITVDSAGAAYITGGTGSPSLDPTGGTQYVGLGEFALSDSFIAKVSALGQFVYFTYQGGTGDDSGTGIVVDASGNATIVGETFAPPGSTSLEVPSDTIVARVGRSEVDASDVEASLQLAPPIIYFPVTPSTAVQPTFGGGESDAFLLRATATGGIRSSTFLGGAGYESAVGVGVDANNNFYVTGYTASNADPSGTGGFPVVNALQTTLGSSPAPDSTCPDGSAPVNGQCVGIQNAFVTKIVPPATATAPLTIGYSTYLGGNGADAPSSIAVSPGGTVYLTGSTTSTNFPAGTVTGTITAPTDTTTGLVVGSTLFLTQMAPPPAPMAPPAVETSVPLGTIDNLTPTGTNLTSSALGVAVNPDGTVFVAGATSTGEASGNALGIKIVNTVNVPLDIRPGKSPNNINPRSNGKIKVAMLANADFNPPVRIDRSTITFGRTGTEPSLVRCKTKDVNHDRRPDLVCTFKTSLLGFRPGDTRGVLNAKTIAGAPVVGSDSVRVVPARPSHDDEDDDDD